MAAIFADVFVETPTQPLSSNECTPVNDTETKWQVDSDAVQGRLS
jgi:hypothetical protein